MKLLAIDSSATAASAAIWEDGVLRGEFFINTKLTHSQTLMPMVEALLTSTSMDLSEIDRFAVAAGPGSFTGLRIGVAAVKGMAMAQGKPCAAVSTLEAMACQMDLAEGIVCAVMDARCSQVYNALFLADHKTLTRISEDRALSVEQLQQQLIEQKKRVFLVGDGANLCYNKMKENIPVLSVAPEQLRMQRASGVAKAAERLPADRWITASALMPVYLRPPQAERELKERQALRRI
ncbi:MAG: tRNA (adenosine(37)-N6)-threonylcarbamoyltransferase complex dimerization subunit type 1 TsaB [Clostridiales bacterium]|jgi:tRNA threonylcarbamoyladenosine biosynthesis protein TsaB|nr:tRNA (adenosine(37)-N6)-threonylcarbamoyltransferase complex dimerization subunit type 1 TsaB [Clostridiales bacterium]